MSPKTGRRIGPASQIGANFGISRAPSGKGHLGVICCWRTVRVKIYLEEIGNTNGTSGVGAGMNRPHQMVGPSKCRGIALSLIDCITQLHVIESMILKALKFLVTDHPSEEEYYEGSRIIFCPILPCFIVFA